MTKAETIRQVFQEKGSDLKNKEVIEILKLKGISVTSADVSQAKYKIEKNKFLTIETLRKVRQFILDNGGLEVIEEAIELLKEFDLQKRAY